jgi:hypothetical protein
MVIASSLSQQSLSLPEFGGGPASQASKHIV